MKAYYAWRFWNIRKNNAERASKQPTDDERAAKPTEEQSKREQAGLQKKIDAEENSARVQQARRETSTARMKLQQTQMQLTAAQQSSSGWMVPMNAEQAQQFAAQRAQQEASAKSTVADARRQLAVSEQAQAVAEDPMRRLQAQKDTLPSQGTLGRNWRQYDERLYSDAQRLAQNTGMKQWLRPHYRALVQAWEDEFVNNKGLINSDVMKFFENYVHDSLADFAKDATLPSDPRVVYVGGDEIALFAMNVPMTAEVQSQAA